MQITEEQSQHPPSTADGIWLIVYDLDQTLTICHTEGDPVIKKFELPNWRVNLRAIDQLRIHFATMKKYCRLSIGTFGWFTDRVEGYRRELWLEPEECLYHAEYVNTKKDKQVGKNSHICSLIAKHYETPNATKIKGVLLVDDDVRNISCLSYYRDYVQNHYPNDPRFEVMIDSCLVPQPGFEMRPTEESTEEIPVEFFYSRYSFLSKLKEIERKFVPIPSQTVAPQTESSSTSDDEWPLVQAAESNVFKTYKCRARLSSSMDCKTEHTQDIQATSLKSEREFLLRSK